MSAPRFSLSLGSSDAVAGEPVRVSFRLRAGSAPLSVPLARQTTDVVSVEVLSPEGELIAAGDGYAKRQQVGLAANFVAQGDMATEPLDPGQEIAWDDALTGYVGALAPGEYRVRARFRFDPAKIDCASDAVPLTVRPLRCAHLDVVSDKVLLATTTFLVQHRDGGEARTFARVARTKAPGSFWEGTALPVPAGAAARVSEADFVTTHTFAHDFARAAAWIDRERQALAFTTFVESSAPAEVISVPLDVPRPALLGRPIRHADGSLSVIFTGGDADEARVVYELHVDPDGRERGLRAIVSLYPQNEPLTAAPDAQGRLYLLTCGSPDRPPLLAVERGLDGAIATREIVARTEDVFVEDAIAGRAPRVLRLLGARLVVKAYLGARAVLFAGVVDHDPEDANQDDVIVIGQAFLDAPPEGLRPLEVRRVVLARGSLARDEAFVAADLARTRGREVHALVGTSRGRLLHVRPGGRAFWCARMAADRPSLLALVATAEHDVHAFFAADDVGVGELVLEHPPRP